MYHAASCGDANLGRNKEKCVNLVAAAQDNLKSKSFINLIIGTYLPVALYTLSLGHDAPS